MTDIIHGTFPRQGVEPARPVSDAALQRILRFAPELERGHMADGLAATLCAVLPDIVEELLEHRRRATADAARTARLSEIEDAAHAAETIARDGLAEATNIKSDIFHLRRDITQLQHSLVELARRTGHAPTPATHTAPATTSATGGDDGHVA